MAGVSVTIDFDDAGVQAMLSRLGEFGGEPIQQALQDVGEALFKSTLERAALEESPDGVRWADLSPRYAARKAKLRPGLPMLKFDNRMLGDMFSFQVGDGFVDIGTNAIYGASQQFGGGGITARPFLGESEQDATTLRKILAEHLQGAIDGR